MRYKKIAIAISCLAIPLPAVARPGDLVLNCFTEAQTNGGEPMVYHISGQLRADPYNWYQYNLASNPTITVQQGTKIYARNAPLRRNFSDRHNYNDSVWTLESSVYGLTVSLSEPLQEGTSATITHTLNSRGTTLTSYSTCRVYPVR